VRGPPRVCDACKTSNMVAFDISGQLSNTLGTARASQATVFIDGNTTGVITPVLEAFKSLNQNRGDVARSDGANDAAHRRSPKNVLLCPIWYEILFHKKTIIEIFIYILLWMKYNFIHNHN
jgi:hypothetical protein